MILITELIYSILITERYFYSYLFIDLRFWNYADWNLKKEESERIGYGFYRVTAFSYFSSENHFYEFYIYTVQKAIILAC